MGKADRIDIRAELHTVIGHLRRNEWINAHDLVVRMSNQMDEEFYNPRNDARPKGKI